MDTMTHQGKLRAACLGWWQRVITPREALWLSYQALIWTPSSTFRCWDKRPRGAR